MGGNMVNHKIAYTALVLVIIGLATGLVVVSTDGNSEDIIAENDCIAPSDVESAVTPLLQKVWSLGKGQTGDQALVKSYTLQNFNAAFAWMTAIGIKAEAVQHHPEWFNVWNTVDVAWTTHVVCNGLSQRDIDMATFCDATTVQVG